MTTIEHAFLGVDAVLTAGLTRRYGWKLAAMAGVAATLPDWDGLTLLWSVNLFDTAHRCWGHSIIACVLLSALFAVGDYRFDWMNRIGRFFLKHFQGKGMAPDTFVLRDHFLWSATFVWVAVGVFAGITHLIGDTIVSGHQSLQNWGIKILWPLSDCEVAYPLIPWGDVGVSVVFTLGLFAMLRWQARARSVAAVTLVAVALYVTLRGFVMPFH
ncbi:MAG: metal-dependent hydrolase [Planctomycetaceae bacterium]|nr:metal-dependent hydrolase [Planctomycetaceae bacterium]